MSGENIDVRTVMLAEAYAKDAYRQGYAKGLKKGISIGSHQAYDYFIRKERWVDSYDLSGDFWCPLCGQEVGDEDPFDEMEDDWDELD